MIHQALAGIASAMLILLLLFGCVEQTTQDCVASKRGNGQTLMCCYTGPGVVGPQWRCAWVHPAPEA